jgi:hypothetical protein
MSEAAKVLPLILDKLEGKRVLDLGCGIQKVVPWAVGVDDCSESAGAKPDIVAGVGSDDRLLASADDGMLEKLLSRGLPGLGEWPVVFSSHTLEHLREPIEENLRYWWSFVAPGGLLILYLPDEARYVYDTRSPLARNPAHAHLLTQEVVLWHLDQITGAKVLTHLSDGYSTLFIVEKTK